MDNWLDGIAAAIGTAWLALLSIFARRELKRIDSKADRDQLDRVITLLEKRDEQYRQDMKEASENRRRLHEKFDTYATKQDEIIRQLIGELSRLSGRMNGSKDHG